MALPSLTARSFNEEDLSDKPKDVNALPLVDPATQQTLFTQRLRALAALDEAVAGIVASLEAAGTLDDTVIMFTSDNGYLFGEHRLVGKNVPYEESIRVPLVMRGPEIPVGERRKQIVAMVDWHRPSPSWRAPSRWSRSTVAACWGTPSRTATSATAACSSGPARRARTRRRPGAGAACAPSATPSSAGRARGSSSSTTAPSTPTS
nr:sulfatase-like hydrolase/transferase [Nocardioides sp. B-3]